jgi:hypothetical protein
MKRVEESAHKEVDPEDIDGQIDEAIVESFDKTKCPKVKCTPLMRQIIAGVRVEFGGTPKLNQANYIAVSKRMLALIRDNDRLKDIRHTHVEWLITHCRPMVFVPTKDEIMMNDLLTNTDWSLKKEVERYNLITGEDLFTPQMRIKEYKPIPM